MILSRFTSCINVLLKYSLLSVTVTGDILVSHREQLLLEKIDVSNEVKIIALNAKRANERYKQIISYIQRNDLPALQQSLKVQQNGSIYSSVMKLTIGRIIKKKTEVERYESIIAENNLRVKQIAKTLLSIINEINDINKEMDMLSDCLKVQAFLNSIGRDVQGITSYEIPNLHKLYLESGLA